MSKAYILALIDYEEFEPICVYLNKTSAEAQCRNLNDEASLDKEMQKKYVKETGQYYPLNWDRRWRSSSESYTVYETEFHD